MALALTGKIRSLISAEVNELLGRAYSLYRIPLTYEEIVDWWEGSLNTDLVLAYHKVKHAYPQTGRAVELTQQRMSLEFNTGKYFIKFAERLMFIQDTSLLTGYPWTLGREKWKDLQTWVVNAAQIQEEFTIAFTVCERILEMCNTLGQLNRALPELVGYLSPGVRAQLRDQARSSTMPYAWAAFDKESVNICRNSLAKAHLMAPSPYRWNEFSVTWAYKALR